MLLPVVLAEQIQPGTFEFALDHLIDHELDLSALDAKYRNQETGASAYDPRVYSQRIATGEPAFANIRHTKRLDHFTLRGKEKVGTQWRLYCLVHNIEKIGGLGELARRG